MKEVRLVVFTLLLVVGAVHATSRMLCEKNDPYAACANKSATEAQNCRAMVGMALGAGL